MKKTILLFFFILSGILISEAQVSCSNTCDNINLQQFRNESLRLINNYRENMGKERLVIDQFLNEAAQNYVEWCVRNVRSYERNPHEADGTTHEQRISRVIDIRSGSYDFKGTGENVARGYPCAKEAFEGWKSSSSHNWQMLNQDHEYIGFGIACYDGTFIAAQVFGNQKFQKASQDFKFNDDFRYDLSTHEFSFSYEASKDFAKRNRNIWPFLEYRIYDEYGDEWNYGGIGSTGVNMGVVTIEREVGINSSYPDKRVKPGYQMKIRYFDGRGYQEKYYNIGPPVNFVAINSSDFVKDFTIDKDAKTARVRTERQRERRSLQMEVKYDGRAVGWIFFSREEQDKTTSLFTNRVKSGTYELWIDNRPVKTYTVGK